VPRYLSASWLALTPYALESGKTLLEECLVSSTRLRLFILIEVQKGRQNEEVLSFMAKWPLLVGTQSVGDGLTEAIYLTLKGHMLSRYHTQNVF
jgi:hypothetical protein